MVECVQPEPMKTIADPACRTGGFFLAAYDFIAKQKLDKTQKHFLKHQTFFGNEIVPNTRRMCLMNLFLHNIGDFESENFISPADALISDSGLRVDYVLANPPFGRKSSMTATNEEGEQEKDELTYNRQDFWETSSNKQLNFVQHIRTMLKSTGQAAVVLPDNVLFEGGAGETHPTFANRYILQTRGKSKCAFLRQQTCIKTTLDKRHLDLRFQNQHSFYTEKKSAKT
jgi:type I restriction enzyme M protein